MPASRFDLSALFEAVDAERMGRHLSWAHVSREVGVATSTIRRFAVADDAEADGVLALVRWLGVAPERFTASGVPEEQQLRALGPGVVRVDMERVRSVALGIGTERTRMSIQALVAVAADAGVAVASLTRLADG